MHEGWSDLWIDRRWPIIDKAEPHHELVGLALYLQANQSCGADPLVCGRPPGRPPRFSFRQRIDG